MAILHPPAPQTAVAFKDREYSYQDLHDEIGRFVQLLGADAGDRVAIFAENRPEWVFALYAAWHLGASVVPIDMMSSAEELAYILDDCQPPVVFCTEQTRETLDQALGRSTHASRVISFESAEETPPATAFCFQEPEMDALAVTIYTSGTTGDPKGVMLTFSNLESNRRYLERVGIYLALETRVIAILPFHHAFPLQGCLVIPLSTGGMMAIVDQLSAEAIVSTLKRQRITMIIGVPRLYTLLHDGVMKKIRASAIARLLFWISSKVNRLGFSRLVFGSVQRGFGGHIRFFISGGARLDPEINQHFRWLGFETLEGYGLTETSPMTTYNPPGQVKVGSVGVTIDDVSVRIVDDEVLISGPNVMRGYYNKPKATAEAIRGGWFYSGDLGHLDEDGYLYITGRKKELIILDNGKNVSPEEIESRIMAAYPLIKDIGVYQDGDRLAAIIVPCLETAQKEQVVNLEETIRYAVIDAYNRQAATYKRITELTLVREDLPRTRLGKLRRFALPELATDERETAPMLADPEGEEFALIKRYLEDAKGLPVHGDQHLELELGLDSLDKIELLVFLDRSFGVKVEEELLASHATPRGLAELMSERKTRISEETLDWKDILSEDLPVSLPKRVFLLTIFKWIFRPLSRLYFRLEVSGLENLPAEGGFLITPNHQSHLDALIVAAFLRTKTLKNTYFFAKEKHFHSWWRRVFASNSNIILMNLNRELKLSVQKIAAVLRRGKNMVIFPEGTRSEDGTLSEFKKTFAILSKELDVPVIPVAISGAFRSMSTGTLIPRPVKIRLEFLAPILPEGHNYQSLTMATRETIEDAV